MGAKININERAKIKLLPKGVKIYTEYFTNKGISPYPPIDIDGVIVIPLWEAMNIFGAYLYMGCDPPIDTTIELEKHL